MCGGGSDPGGDTSAADIEATQGMGYSTTTSTAAGNDPTGNTGGQTDQGISDPSSVTDDNITTDPDAGLSYSAIANIGNAKNQAQPGDVTGFGGQIGTGADVSDFTTADQLTSMSNSINNPLSNFLTKLGLPTTQNRINQGYTPSYTGPKYNQQITGTMDYGIGMGMPTNDLNMTGRGLAVSNYSPFDATQPQVDFGDINDVGDDGSESPQIIRRNPSDPILEEELDPVLSDDLAVNYLQNPNYLYSGQGNLYQPYGYAQGTLVDLLRTRNLTQPQQRAANLGLFGNPGDFS